MDSTQVTETGSHVLEWIIGIGTFITAVTGFLALFFKKKPYQSNKLIKSILSNTEIQEILGKINSEFTQAQITSILAVTNHDIPLNYQTLFSTDFQTHHLWKNPVRISNDLNKLLSEVARKGYSAFEISKVQDFRIKVWFEKNSILTSHFFSIGVGEYYLNGQPQTVWLLLTVNWREAGELDGNTILRFYDYLVDLQTVFKTLSRKRFLSAPPPLKVNEYVGGN